MNDENVVFNSTDTPEGNSPPIESNQESPGVVEVSAGDGGSTNIVDSTTSPSGTDQVSPDSAPQQQLEADGGDSSEAPPPRAGGGKLKKLIIGLIGLIILVVAVIIFWPKGAEDTNGDLLWWGLWEDAAVVAPIIDGFQKENPNIKIEYVKQDPKQYREKLQTRIRNGTGPDVFRFHNTWVDMLSGDLSVLPTDVIKPDEFKKNFYTVMQEDLSRNGAIYGIPIGADALVLFTNNNLMDAGGIEPPNTWEEFVDASRRLTVKDQGKIVTAGAALGTFGNVTHAPDIISLLFLQQGINMRKFPDSKIEDKSAALSFYTSFAKGEQNVWDSTLDDSIILFSKGNLGMYIGYSWDIFRIRALNPELKFETNQVPQLVGRDIGLASYWAEGVSAKSKNQKAAFLFMKYLAKKETAEKFYTETSKTREFGEVYARVDLASKLEKNQILAPFIKELPAARSSFFASDTYDGEGGINSLANVYLGNAVNAIINDNSSTETVVDTLDQGVIQVFDKYGIK